ncbi:hypothetical protein NDU88_001005 [Pleurodeles waltl]|uniref:Uncharacterized protein n=1 Tax=Pleurodeles waltl TaxID=8319 RepID=A0AAV7SBN9_PLEWA|nr:hypothetical protein NDU88_001005 [Pleurodeles waltl]
MGKIRCKKGVEAKDESIVSPWPGSQVTNRTHLMEKMGDPTLQEILQAITASREVLEGNIDAFAADLIILSDDHRRLGEKLTLAAKQIEEILPSVSNAAKTISKMEKQIHDLDLRAEDAEN